MEHDHRLAARIGTLTFSPGSRPSTLPNTPISVTTPRAVPMPGSARATGSIVDLIRPHEFPVLAWSNGRNLAPDFVDVTLDAGPTGRRRHEDREASPGERLLVPDVPVRRDQQLELSLRRGDLMRTQRLPQRNRRSLIE
ncbi:MAG: hypothetical protein HY616_06240 [Candidatus Rokubacteria bacterium]|nr:hypothetical protein [Candidatus Rokubacteria bacterium]